MIVWNERTIWRKIDEEGWREQQEYRRRVWRNKIEFEKLVQDTMKPAQEPKP